MSLERMVKGMHARMSVSTSRIVLMTSIIFRYIIKALKIEFDANENGYDHRILVILTGAYLVITFGYL